MSVPPTHTHLRGPATAPYFHPFFLIFQIPPPGEAIKIYFPPALKMVVVVVGGGGGGCPNYVIYNLYQKS